MFHITATADPVGKRGITLQESTSLLPWSCLFIDTDWLVIILSYDGFSAKF